MMNINPSELKTIVGINSKQNETRRDKFANGIQSVTSEYKTLDDVLAIVIGGSVARGFADDKSDVEMYVYSHEEIPVETEIKRIMDNLGAYMTRSSDLIWEHKIWGPHTFFALGDVYFELGYRVFPDIESKVRRYLSGEDILPHLTREADTPFGHYTSGIASCIQSSRIMFEDDTQNLSLLKKKLEDFSHELLRKLFDFYFNEADTMLRVKLTDSSQRDDELAFNAQLASILRSMNISLFAINRTHFPGDKWNSHYIEQFKLKPQDYESTLNTLLSDPDKGSENKFLKCILLERLLGDINDLYQSTKNE